MSMTQRKFAIIFSITEMQKDSRLCFKAVSFFRILCCQLRQGFLMASPVNLNPDGSLLQNPQKFSISNGWYASLKVRLSAEAKRLVQGALESGVICHLTREIALRLCFIRCFVMADRAGI